MYITQMPHFLDETGNIPKQMPKEARELASFMALVVDATTKEKSFGEINTGIRCFQKKCDGQINSQLDNPLTDIHWKCLEQQPIGWEPDLNDGARLKYPSVY